MGTVAVTEQGARVSVEGDLLVVSKEGRPLRKLRLADVDQVLLFGRVELSSGAVARLARRRLDVVFLSANGNFRARLVSHTSRNVALRLAQFEKASDPAFCLGVARSIVAGKIQHQRQILLRAQRRLQDPSLADALAQMRQLLERVPRTDHVDSLRGLEGQAASLYFAHFGRLLLNDQFSFHRRTRRPPRDPVNACLSFGYALLGTVAESEVARCGLDPMVGFFHQPAYGRPSLVLDLIEEFRPHVDMLVLRLFNLRQLAPTDFRRLDTPPVEALLAGPDGPATDSPAEPSPLQTAQPPTADVGPNADHPQETDPDAEQETELLQPDADFDDAPSDPEPPGPGVYLQDPGRRVFLNAFFKRLRTRLYYPPRQASLELRDILREQTYQLARVVQGQQQRYDPFVPK